MSEDKNEKDILTYLEGEIKIDNETDLIHIGNHIDIMVHLWPGGNRIVARKEVCDFIATALINERERRKNEVFKPLENWENKPFTPKKEEGI